MGVFDINLYQSRYRHFLFEQESVITTLSFGQKISKFRSNKW